MPPFPFLFCKPNVKELYFSLLLAAGYLVGWAQAVHPGAGSGRALYCEASSPAAGLRTRAALGQQPGELLGGGAYEASYLRTFDGCRILVLGLRHHVGQRVASAGPDAGK